MSLIHHNTDTAQMQNPEDTFRLGCSYLVSSKFSKDREYGLSCLKIAADAGHTKAQLIYANSLPPGLAIHYFKMAADSGNSSAQISYAKLCQDPEESIRYFKLAAEQGNQWALVELGRRLGDSSYFVKASTFGNSDAFYELGMIQKRQKCFDEALRLFQKAGNYPPALYEVSLIIKETSILESIQPLKKSADMGYSRAMLDYARYLELHNDKSARDYYQKAMGKDNTAAFEYVKYLKRCGLPYRDELQAAADFGDAEAELEFARFLSPEDGGENENIELAKVYFKRAADHGNPDVEFECARFFQLCDDLEESASIAAEYFRRASDQGHKLARRAYLACLRKGKGVPKNPEYAEFYARRFE